MAKTCQKPYAKTPQKTHKNFPKTCQKSGRQKSFMSLKLSGQNIGQKFFYENINKKSIKIYKNFVILISKQNTTT